MSGYPTVGGKPNCQVNFHGNLYNWTTNSFHSLNVTRSHFDGHKASDYDILLAWDLGDYIKYKGWTIQSLEVSVSDHSTKNWDTMHFFRPYDTRMCSPNGSKPRWDCGYYLVGAEP
ncbi:hypothetical protein ACFQYP_15515 [Nonomuraea antimicrobica]